MSGQDRSSYPPDVFPPFVATEAPNDHQEGIAAALDHIAKALSAIDHNLAILIAELDNDSLAVSRLAASLEGKSS